MSHAKRLLVAIIAVLPIALIAQQADSTVYKPGDGVSLPKVVKEVRPQYTSEAMQQRIEGRVELECVVRPDGKATDIKVVRSLDSVYGLDKNATEALAQWEFKPGTKDDKAVAVQIQVQMAFTLK
jgi:protein TonB